MSHFGEHLTYDGYGADPTLLDSPATVSSALTNLTSALGMSILAGPDVHFAPGTTGKDPGGWTGMVVLQESHISMHTFPARCFISADVYTCQNGLDIEAIRTFFQQHFGVSDDELNFIKRGTRYPSYDLHPGWTRSPEIRQASGPPGA